jgi:hypothetical protein
MRRAGFMILAGCAASPHVPAQLQGHGHMVIANQMNAPLCTFAITPDGTNWLGDTIVRPLERTSFDVKPGRYHIEATTCGTHERASGTIDFYNYMIVAIGPWREPRPAYVLTSVVPAVGP